MGKRILIISLVLALIMVMVLPMGVGATGGTEDGNAIGTVGYEITSNYTISLSTSDLLLTSAPNIGSPVSTAPFTITITSNSETYKYGAITVKGEDGKLSAGRCYFRTGADDYRSITLRMECQRQYQGAKLLNSYLQIGFMFQQEQQVEQRQLPNLL